MPLTNTQQHQIAMDLVVTTEELLYRARLDLKVAETLHDKDPGPWVQPSVAGLSRDVARLEIKVKVLTEEIERLDAEITPPPPPPAPAPHFA